MPKKHQQNFTKPSSNYVHPSLRGSKSPASPTAGSSKSVNERLNQLRREQAPKADVARRNEVATVASQRTVPPALRQILNLPETAPPKPKPGTNNRVRGRRVPGPPAPQSWLESSRHAPASFRKCCVGEDIAPPRPMPARRRPHGSSLLSKLCNGIIKGSLIHYTLKTMALNWGFLLEYEQYNLATLPVQLKSSLISYLARYGPDEGIKIDTLKTLFQTSEELSGGTGSEEVKELDLSGLINRNFTVADLNKYATHLPNHLTAALSKPSTAEGTQEKLPTKTIHPSALQQKAPLLDSWEDDLSASTTPSPRIPLSPFRFPSLTHLSLSHPGAAASWTHLLSLSTHLATLTHLSLAYWPVPTLTPNARTASVHARHGGPVPLGGRHFYSSMEDDWDEAANILRRLSNNTYCLKWLDLQGCGEWLPALTFNAEFESERLKVDELDFRNERLKVDELDFVRAASGPNWNGSWSQVEYVNVSQGWVPAEMGAVRKVGDVELACQVLCYLGEAKEDPEMPRVISRIEGDVRRWMERERMARSVKGEVNSIRHAARGKFCEFDFGWTERDCL